MNLRWIKRDGNDVLQREIVKYKIEGKNVSRWEDIPHQTPEPETPKRREFTLVEHPDGKIVVAPNEVSVWHPSATFIKVTELNPDEKIITKDALERALTEYGHSIPANWFVDKVWGKIE